MKKNNTKGFIKRVVVKSCILLILLIKLSSLMAYAQDTGISIQMKNAKLEDVLNEIKNKSDVNIVFNIEQVRKAQPVTINLTDVSVEKALQECLKNTHLEYQKVNNVIVIKPKKVNSEVSAPEPELKTQTIRGRVLDRDSKISLPYANVVVLNSSPTIGVTTDADGYFKIEDLPVGRYSLQFSYIGYQNTVHPEILLGSAKEVVLNIELTEAMQEMEEVVVTVSKGQPLNDMAIVSAKSFSVEETKRYAASISDPARMAQVFAGVSTTDDASNEIVIRGNSPNWMLWRLEGVEIPSPNHFAEEGYTSGAVSILSTNMLGTSDFYTGAFSADYGNALSGVFDIKLRNGNNEQNEYSAQIGVLGVEAAAEGPFKKGYKGSYLINYRYATFSLLNQLNIEISENALPNYQDLSFKLNLPTSKFGTFALWGIGGQADSDERFYPDTTLNEYLEDGYTDYTKTGMYATGLSHTYFTGEKAYIKTAMSLSGSFSSNNVSNMDTLGVLFNDYNDDFSSGAIRFSSYYNHKLSKKLTMRTGASMSLLNFDYFSEYADDNNVMQKGIYDSGETNLYQAYLQGKLNLTNNITLTGGLHYTYFELSADSRLEPRASMLIELKDKQKIGFGFGMHSRHEQLPVYFVAFEDQQGGIAYLHKNLGLTRSTHYVASYEKIIHNDWMVKLEGYYQDISNLLVPKDPENRWIPAFNGISDEDTLITNGKGKNYGLELTVQKFFTNNYYLLFTTSLFESKYQPTDGNWYNSVFNSNYIFNFVGGKEIALRQNKMLSLNAKLLWSGGKRIIPIDLEASREEGETVFVTDQIYGQKAPDYIRLDIGVKFHMFREKSEHIIALDVQNLTNRLNVWTEYYSPRKDEIVNYYMAGLIPILSYRIEF